MAEIDREKQERDKQIRSVYPEDLERLSSPGTSNQAQVKAEQSEPGPADGQYNA